MLRYLSLGMSGPDVLAVQQGLNVWAAGDDLIQETGSFDSETDTAVRTYQDANQLDPDGIVGPITRHSIFPPVVMTTIIVANVLRFPRLEPRPFAFDTSSGQFGAGSGDTPTAPTIFPSIVSQIIPPTPIFAPTRFAGLNTPLHAPLLPSPFLPFGFKFDHCEIAPGTQHTFNFSRSRQDAFVLTMQCIGARGPTEEAHQELVFGTTIGQPLNATDADGNAWTFNPFVQLTDVDRFGALGQFHFWQPYAQAGFQSSGSAALSPTLTFNLFPINLGFDVNRFSPWSQELSQELVSPGTTSWMRTVSFWALSLRSAPILKYSLLNHRFFDRRRR